MRIRIRNTAAHMGPVNLKMWFFLFKVHPCAGKPEGEPTAHYVRAAQDVLVKNLEQYQAAGHELQGRNVTLDRAYTSYEVVRR